MALPPLSTGAGQAPGSVRQGVAQPAGQARAAAQRAFFQAALGRAAAPAGSTSVPAIPVQQVRETPVTPDPNAPSDRIARPGSLVNIVV